MVSDDPSAKIRPISSFKPDSRSLEIARILDRSETLQQNRFNQWIGPFDDLKFELEFEFKGIVDSINNVTFTTIESSPINTSDRLSRILSSDPLILLNVSGTVIHIRDQFFNLPAEYLAHSIKDRVLRVICEGLKTIQIDLEASKEIGSDILDAGGDYDRLFVNSDVCDKLFMISSRNPTKLISW